MGKGCKVVVCGMASVGKTAILEQLLYGSHTVGAETNHTQEDIYVASVETDRGVREQLRLYDTRGLREGLDLPKHFVMVIVLGNKCDLRERRQVDQDAAQQWARGEKLKLWEVTVTDRSTLIDPFTTLTSRLTQPQSKSAFPLPGRKSKGTPSNDI
ncbi:NF-kappa-B inhibitor-interacting Ras-like protein 1 [Garra rufa]|uniref:NF-kappa-B inhibitor-interacting Ras-like protein 1 n=1 Tax=Garra rufa TaxID=137080 RepID=UPI003CCE685D